MKTLIFKNALGEAIVEIKADIFASTSEMADPHFDTKFTAMEIKDTEAAIVLGININESSYSFKHLVKLANDTVNVGLSVIDLSESVGEVTIVDAV